LLQHRNASGKALASRLIPYIADMLSPGLKKRDNQISDQVSNCSPAAGAVF